LMEKFLLKKWRYEIGIASWKAHQVETYIYIAHGFKPILKSTLEVTVPTQFHWWLS
jgi:hypothetical protein